MMGTDFGNRLRTWRLAKGLTQRQVAEALRVTPTYVNLMEKGRTKAPTLERCRQLAELLSVDSQGVIQVALEERDPAVQQMLLAASAGDAVAVPVFPWTGDRPLVFTERRVPQGRPVRHFAVQGTGESALFALEVPDDAPAVPSPGLPRGDVLVFSAEADVLDGDPALVRTDDFAAVGRIRHQQDGSITLLLLNGKGEGRRIARGDLLGLSRMVYRIVRY